MNILNSGLPGSRVLMLGNEAMARGAIEAGVQLATSYPGTPSSEILGSIAEVAKELGIHAEWSTNEKVAFETAIGGAIAGLRSLCSMKHVGVNWAADPLMAVNQTGVEGGLVLIATDDTGGYASQNEQDTRYYAMMAELPMLEPSDVPEAKEMVKTAFDVSEKLNLVVMMRPTIRVCHGRADVTLDPLQSLSRQGKFVKDPGRWFMSAWRCRARHKLLHEKQSEIQQWADATPFNKLNIAGDSVGIIASGATYTYVMDALTRLNAQDRVSTLKIGTHPIPRVHVRRLLENTRRVIVFEEVEPIVEQQVKTIAYDHRFDVEILGKLSGDVQREWDLDPAAVKSTLARTLGLRRATADPTWESMVKTAEEMAPERFMLMCAGCPHTATFAALKRALMFSRGKAIYSGDIGCYTLGVSDPVNAQDTNYCMGASIGVGCGFAHANVEEPVVATIGDSTFIHAGLPALINATYNNARMLVVILDNTATAMTGFQPHPGTGITATNDEVRGVRIEELAHACGADFVEVVDPFNFKESVAVMEKALKHPRLAVVISRRECMLITQRKTRSKGEATATYSVDMEACNGCKVCISFGCPAIVWTGEKAEINETLCNGCGVCAQICPLRVIHPAA
ncbi:MAG: indolepyruvate ferredoxin oxidoreductase subunit alpha [Candidatus Bathyarchaeia archaeon]